MSSVPFGGFIGSADPEQAGAPTTPMSPAARSFGSYLRGAVNTVIPYAFSDTKTSPNLGSKTWHPTGLGMPSPSGIYRNGDSFSSNPDSGAPFTPPKNLTMVPKSFFTSYAGNPSIGSQTAPVVAPQAAGMNTMSQPMSAEQQWRQNVIHHLVNRLQGINADSSIGDIRTANAAGRLLRILTGAQESENEYSGINAYRNADVGLRQQQLMQQYEKEGYDRQAAMTKMLNQDAQNELQRQNQKNITQIEHPSVDGAQIATMWVPGPGGIQQRQTFALVEGSNGTVPIPIEKYMSLITGTSKISKSTGNVDGLHFTGG